MSTQYPIRFNMKRLFLMLSYVIIFAGRTSSAEPLASVMTPMGIAALPEYCQAKFGDDRLGKERWAQALGRDNWHHLGHYCSGLLHLNKAKASVNNKKRNGNLGQAIRHFDYVLARWPKSSPLYKAAENNKMLARTLLITAP